MAFYSFITNVWEELDSVHEDMDIVTGVTNCSVVLSTPYSQRYTVADDLLLNRRPWPHFPGSYGNPPLAFSVGISYRGCDSTIAAERHTYEHALLTVNYTNSPVVDLFTESIEPTAEFIKHDYRQFKWKDDEEPLLEGEAPGDLKRGLNVVRNIHDVALPLSTEILDLTGTVNKEEYEATSLGIKFPEETLLYSPPVINKKFKSDGTAVASLTLKLQYKKGGWNKYWRSKIKDYDQIVKIEDDEVVENYEPVSWIDKETLKPIVA